MRRMAPTDADVHAQGATPLLRGAGLSKRFRSVAALEDVSIQLERGDAVALLGPNGAGKTTLLRILAGVSTPTQGAVNREERSVSHIGWVPHEPAVYRRLTARENILLFTRLEGVDSPEAETAELLERTDLARFADRPAGDLSTGTLQRLNVALGLAGRPSALLLDEPTATLSPDQVNRLWRWLDELRVRDGLAVLFSTQSVDEAGRYAERMVILNHGRQVFAGTADELVTRHGTPGTSATDAAERAFLNLVDA